MRLIALIILSYQRSTICTAIFRGTNEAVMITDEYLSEITMMKVSTLTSHKMNYVVIFNDITADKQLEMKLMHHASHDHLTNMREINVQHGLAAGDQLLRQIAKRLQSAMRMSSTIVRISNDEFAVLIPDLRRKEDHALIGERIHLQLSAPFSLNTPAIYVEFTLGYSFYPDDGVTLDELIKHAIQDYCQI